MRRRSASRTSTNRPSSSRVSPTAGTRPSTRQDVAADGLEAFGFDLEIQPIAELVETDLGAEDVRAVAFLHDRIRLDVVFVADLADDLLEKILDGDEAGGAAVFVDDDRHLDLPALELLQQLRHALGFGDERGRTRQRHDRLASGAASSSFSRSLTRMTPRMLSRFSL